MLLIHANMKRFLTSFLTVVLGALPGAALAQTELTNPLGETDVRLIIARVIEGVLGFTGSLALLAFVYGGFLWITAMGQPKRIEKGKEIFVWAILGIIMISSAYVVVNAIFQAVLTGSPSV